MPEHYKHIKQFLFDEETQYLLSKLENEIPWRQVRYFKPERGYVITPRLTWVCGFHQQAYYDLKYASGKIVSPNPIPSWLDDLKSVIEEHLNQSFNYVLFAQYRDNNDSITYHSDNERFLGYNPTIASISIGSDKTFCLKNKASKKVETFNLQNGDLFVMKNNCQRDYLHSVPKNSSGGKRFSLTFRNALNETGSKNYYKYN
jgi:alkylated DNA repair dioxygenase AlkB